ncbi:MAG: hypothetical protein AAFR87_27100 [Bacteroidota bacterium]
MPEPSSNRATSEKVLSFQIEAPYYTQGEINENTKEIWIICHGYGQMARYFLRRFDVLDSETHFLIAPQGLDRFYFDNFTKLGASWTTRELRDTHVSNQQTYLNAMYEAELAHLDLSKYTLRIMGFSQGVSVITRWAVQRKVPFDHMIMWAGGFPPNLTADKWAFRKPNSKVSVLVGSEDPFLKKEKLEQEKEVVKSVFPDYEFVMFEGGHQVLRTVLQDLMGIERQVPES